MKKILSILMSILIIVLSFTVMASAAGHPCKDHIVDPEIGCHCCIDCPNLDEDYVTSCIKDGKRCCVDCRGVIPCDCGCPCCATDADNGETSGNGQILTPDQQEQVIDGFQGVLARIREFFDKLFDMIFEFLRFDEIMGN